MPQAFGIRACGVPIVIRSDAAPALETLRHYLVPWEARVHPSALPSPIVFSVESTQVAGEFSIRRDDQLLSPAEKLLGLFAAVQRVVDQAIVERLTGHAVIHAGVVAANGTVVLLPGSSGAGKTTLVAELVRRGAEYYSDEYALVDELGRVHPYPRPLMLRDAGGVQHPVLPQQLKALVATRPKPAAFVLLLQAQLGSEQPALSLTRLDQSEGLLHLLKHTPQALEQTPGMLPPLRALATGAAFYQGSRGDAAAAAENILHLAEFAG